MNKNLTDQFTNLLFTLAKSQINEQTYSQARKCFLDYLGVGIVGSELIRTKGEKFLNLVKNSKGNSTLIGFKQTASVENAVFLNGMSSHIAELDDGSRFGVIHPGTPIISALLSIAEQERVELNAFLKGIIIGYEAAIRLSYAMQPDHYNKGFHPTATCGSIGAAIGIAAMLGATEREFKDAISAAGISASGSLKVIENTSELKPFNSGRSALIGYMSYLMSKSGFSGPIDALGGDTGFLSMMSDTFNEEILTQENPDSYYINKVYFKPYAACRHAHSAIEAVISIKNSYNPQIESIKSIKIKTYKGVIGKHDHNDIHGEYSAKMSIPYGTAIALLKGKAGLEEFKSVYVNDKNILAFVNKIQVVPDEEITSWVPQKRAAIVEITMLSGEKFSKQVDLPKGEPENPLSNAEVIEKFMGLATFAKRNKYVCDKIVDIVFNNKESLNNLYQYLR